MVVVDKLTLEIFVSENIKYGWYILPVRIALIFKLVHIIIGQ